MLDEKNSVTDFCRLCLGSYLCFLLTGTCCDSRFGREPDHLHTRYVNVYSFLLYLYIYVLLLTRFHHVHVSLLFLFISSYVCNDLSEIKNMFCSVLYFVSFEILCEF